MAKPNKKLDFGSGPTLIVQENLELEMSDVASFLEKNGAKLVMKIDTIVSAVAYIASEEGSAVRSVVFGRLSYPPKRGFVELCKKLGRVMVLSNQEAFAHLVSVEATGCVELIESKLEAMMCLAGTGQTRYGGVLMDNAWHTPRSALLLLEEISSSR